LAAAVIIAARPKEATAGTRLAVVIGNNVGLNDEARLHYAESDARRIAQILTEVGGFAPTATTLLEGRSADDIRRALRTARDRLESSGDSGLLLVYYSGHADGDGLHPNGSALPFEELRQLLHEHAIATRIMIVDACKSGALTSVKGGRAGPSFEIVASPAADPQGLAIITSSAAGEESQESAELQASFFTHHFATGLLGAADRDGDGTVTLAEAYAYAARRTVGATSATWAGPQHPTYSLDLGGRDDLVLTRPWPGASGERVLGIGHLRLRQPGWYFVRRRSDELLVAEIDGEASDRQIALREGRYEVMQRLGDHMMVGDFDVVAAATTSVEDDRMRRIDYGRVVRKGGSTRTRAIGVYADGAVRGSLLGLGAAPAFGIGARMDVRRITVLAEASWSDSFTMNALGSRLDTTELGLRLAAMRAIDFSRLTVAYGIEGGVSRFTQSSTDRIPVARSDAPVLGALALFELPLFKRYFAWLEADVPVYLVDRVDASRSGDARRLSVTYRGSLALGGYF
jgi:hypothetical protein